MNINELLTYLDGVQKKSGYYIARCPAHDDKKQSLSISVGEGGKILLKCHAGCSCDAVVRALGLSFKDLFADTQTSFTKPQIIAVYDYGDCQKLRRSDKSFIWRRPDGMGGWIYNRQGIPHKLYVAGTLENKVVFIAEGEKDADNLHKLGYDAASGEDGAGHGKWRQEYTEQLRDCTVAIFPDNDTVGREYAAEVAAALKGVASDVRLLDLRTVWADIPEHWDISDLIQKFGEGEACNMIAQMLNASETWEQQAEETASIQALLEALDKLGITLKYNQLTKSTEISGLPCIYSTENAANVLPVYLVDYFKSCDIKGFTLQNIGQYLACIADRNRYNPVKDYLLAGGWDGQDRFNEVYRILGVTDERHRMYIKKWFIQCVAIAISDTPINAEGVLVLQGEQGMAKTSFFRIMTPFPQWFVEGAVIDVRDKDTLINALSGWITELGELDATLKREQSALKAFITKGTDSIRPPYGKMPITAQRRTSFCGTVNPQDYLRDETGSRRFWTVPLTKVNKRALFSLSRTFVHQLWYQTYCLYRQDPNGFRLTDREISELQQANNEFSVPLPYEQEIRELFNPALDVSAWEWWRTSELTDAYFWGRNATVPIGKVLNKIVREFQKAGTETLRKSSKGSFIYKLPIRHRR